MEEAVREFPAQQRAAAFMFSHPVCVTMYIYLHVENSTVNGKSKLNKSVSAESQSSKSSQENLQTVSADG